jgi:NADPH:quinone reductase-like Zn-dependent oxidoreductase
MKAAVCKSYGPPEVLKIEDIEQPVILDEHDDRVLIKVHSASVNPYDYLHRKGYLLTRMENGWTKPKQQILGIDVAGTVEAVGKNVTRFKVGDAVFGHCLGSHAEYVRARQERLGKMPRNLTFTQAAAVPCVALTALQAFRDIAQIKKGQRVLVYGASGGIGHFAVQFAKYYETEVTAVCSTSNLPWVKELGADHVIDYSKEDFARNGKKYDIILIAAGKRTYFSSKPSLTATSMFISESPKPEYGIFQIFLSPLVGDKRAKMHLSQPNEKDIEFIRELIEADKIKPVIEKAYSLDQIAQAHRHVENGHTKGKVVIEVQKSS